jgi:adenylate cyclase
MTAAARGRAKAVLKRVGLGRALGFLLLAGVVATRIWDPAPIETLRLRTFDLYQVAHPRKPADLPIVIVDIDEESLAALGQWPWPRTLVSALVARLRNAPAIAVGFDIIFVEADRMSPGPIAKSLVLLDDATREQLLRLPSNDEIFARTLKETRVILGQSGHHREIGDFSRPIKAPPLASIGGDPKRYLPQFAGLVRNIEILEDAAPGQGAVTLLPDADNVVRSVNGAVVVRDTVLPSLVLEMLRVATGSSAIAIKVGEAGIKSYVVGGVEVPSTRDGRIWVYYGAHDPNRYVSAHEVLSGAVPKERLANKLVLIGTSATGLFDIKATPLNPVMPGVEVHAQLLETILASSYLLRPNYALGAELTMTAVVGLLVVTIIPVLGAVYTLLLGAGVAAVLSGFSWYLFIEHRVLLDVAYPLIGSLAIYVFMVFANYFREEAKRQQVRGAFSQYLSPELVERLAANPDQLVLGGQTREMTILFCDAHGFTAIAERHKKDPQGLTRLMNRLLTPLTHEIVERQGTIDKYIGDAVMAFWNAPLDDPNHQLHACEAALAMSIAVVQLNAELLEEAGAREQMHQALRVGIGINSGDCVVGNFGSDLRFDYSVLGDPVNVASRLEGQSRVYGFDILVGDATARAVEGRVALLELDRLRVKGKDEPERIHALLGDKALAADSGFQALSARHVLMLQAYRTQDWDTATKHLIACRDKASRQNLGLDGYYTLMAARIDGFRAAPPDPDWDGTARADTK